MNRIALTAVLVFIAIMLSIVSGYMSQMSNPNGIWLYTPPADGTGKPSDAFNFGVALTLCLISLLYLAIFLGTYAWSKLKHTYLPTASIQIATAVPIVLLLAVIFLWQTK